MFVLFPLFHFQSLTLGKNLGKAFDIPPQLHGQVFFVAVTLKVSSSPFFFTRRPQWLLHSTVKASGVKVRVYAQKTEKAKHAPEFGGTKNVGITHAEET